MGSLSSVNIYRDLLTTHCSLPTKTQFKTQPLKTQPLKTNSPIAQLHMKEILVPRNNSVYMTLVILCPIALFFGVRFLYQDFYAAEPRWWLVILLGALVVGLAYALAFSIQQVRTSRPAMRISKAGVEDHISMAKPGLIPWKNIKGSKIVKYTGSDHLLIYVKDAKSIVAPLNFLQGKMAQQMIEDVETPIVINPKLIRYDVKKLVAAINRRR